MKAAQKSKELDACIIKNCNGKPDLNAKFTGQAVLTTSNDHAHGPFTNNGVSIDLLFRKFFHETFDVTFFKPIVPPPFPTPVGQNTTTITMKSAKGTFDNSGKVVLDITLHFDHSLVLAGDSDITFRLSTESAQGKRMDAAGKLTLAGTAEFDGGFLDGDSATLVVFGSITPHP